MTTAKREYDAAEFSLANFRRFICGITATDTDDATRPAFVHVAGACMGLQTHLVIRLSARSVFCQTFVFVNSSIRTFRYV